MLPVASSIGSCLQQKTFVSFEHGEAPDEFDFPENDCWVIARELLIFECFHLVDVPKNQRLKVIGQKVRSLSPFAKTGHYVHWIGDHAHVWIWDEGKRQLAITELSERFTPLASHFQQLDPLPETLLQPMGESVPVNRSCIDGVDVQVWRGGRLISSHWVAGVSGVPAEESSRKKAWELEENSFLSESAYWRLGLASLILVLMFQLGAWNGQFTRQLSLSSQLEDERQNLSLLLPVRSRTQELRDANALLREWLSVPSQLSLIADFDARLPESLEIVSWKYGQAILEVVVTDEVLDNRRYVEELTEGTRFSDVRVTPGASAGSVLITLRVTEL